MLLPHPGCSPEEEDDPTKTEDHQDDHYQDHVACDRVVLLAEVAEFSPHLKVSLILSLFLGVSEDHRIE